MESNRSSSGYINAAPPFLFSALIHLAVLVLLSDLAGTAGTVGNQIASANQPRLSVRLPAVSANIDMKRAAVPVIGDRVASDAMGLVSDSGAPNGEMSGHSLIALPDDDYYPASEVDVRATPISAIDLDTEEVRMLASNAIGKTVLKLWIDQSGKVEKVSPLSSDMSSTITDQAVAAFSNARYQAATRHGHAVKTISVIEVNYAGAQ
jgi:hypothetical protein